MAERPLGVHDLQRYRPPDHPAARDHWYWCRVHERAEHVNKVQVGCIRVGPFMSSREAERLDALDTSGEGASVLMKPLGMGIESDG